MNKDGFFYFDDMDRFNFDNSNSRIPNQKKLPIRF